MQVELQIFDGDQTPCSDCDSRCCRAFVVPLTGSDIFRIQSAMGLSLWDFVARWEDPTGEISRGVAPHFRFLDEPQTPFVIGLLHKPSRLEAGTTRCCFLSESVDSCSHCSIYEHRPRPCRIFPATIDKAGQVCDRELHVDSPDGTPTRLCSRRWGGADFDATRVRRDLDLVGDEMQLWQVIADRWNRQLRPWSMFPEFLQLLFENFPVFSPAA